MLGHDLRNPLNSIALCATSLADAPELNEKQLTTVYRMLTGVRRLDHMVSDVIDFARGRLGSGIWDVESLKQVFSNLLLNAIQHGSGKNIGVTMRSKGDFVSVEVHNEGPPIPNELLGAIFDPLVHGKTPD
jgi:signal transduction histidine kinase